MSTGRYARVRLPRPMSFDPSSPVVDYLARLVDAEVNHGMPVHRRLGRVMAFVGRHGLPHGLLAVALRARPRHPGPELDELLATVRDRWSWLAERSDRLPTEAPELSGLLVERTSVAMAFVFGDGPWPLLVAKRLAPGVPDDGLRRERDALDVVAGTELGPRHLGVLDGVWVQEALPGLPMRIPVVDRRNAARLTRPPGFDQLDLALQRLAAHTTHRAPLSSYDAEMLRLATTYDLPDDVAATVERARRHVLASGTVVLHHADLLAQNWIVADGRFSGLVDWETCEPDGLPGSDLLGAAMSAFEHGIALRAWSDELVAGLFETAWASSPYFAETRSALVAVVEAAGLPAADADPLLVAHVAHRLGRKVHADHEGGTVPASVLAEHLTVVCRSLG